MNIETIRIEGKYNDDSEYLVDLKTDDLKSAKASLKELRDSGKVKIASLKIITDDGEEYPERAYAKMTEAVNMGNNVEPGMFMTNENGTIVFIKEVENNIVVFDEEGTERILTYSLFQEYARQENYKVMKISAKDSLKEVIETLSVNEAVSHLMEAEYKSGDKVRIKGFDSPDYLIVVKHDVRARKIYTNQGVFPVSKIITSNK